MEQNKTYVGRNQNLFETLQNVCGFTALQSDMNEIMRAIAKDCELLPDHTPEMGDFYHDMRQAICYGMTETETVYTSDDLDLATKNAVRSAEIEFQKRLASAMKGQSETIARLEKELTSKPKQLCPKCNGQGIVSKPPYVAGDVTEWTASQTSFLCNLCNGNKTI